MKKIILSLFILVPLVSFGTTTASEYQLLEPLPCIQNTGQGESEQKCADGVLLKKINTDTYIAYIFNFSIAFAAVAAVVVIIYAGFEYATSEILTNKSDARNRISNAIWGLITIICSYFILNVIDPRLVDINTQLEPISIVGEAFNYDAIMDDAIGYKIRTDNINAQAEVKALTAEAAELRKLEAQYKDSDPKKAQEYGEQALLAEREAKWVSSYTALQSVGELGGRITENLSGYDDDTMTAEETTSIEQRKNSINNSADKNIQKMIDAGDIVGAQRLEEERAFYVAKLEQDILIKQQQNTINDVKKFNDSRTGGLQYVSLEAQQKYLFNFLKGIAYGSPKDYHEKVQEKVVAKLMDSPIPPGLSAERQKQLENERDEAIRQIRAIPVPQK